MRDQDPMSRRIWAAAASAVSRLRRVLRDRRKCVSGPVAATPGPRWLAFSGGDTTRAGRLGRRL